MNNGKFHWLWQQTMHQLFYTFIFCNSKKKEEEGEKKKGFNVMPMYRHLVGLVYSSPLEWSLQA